jgi:hypothetical protein
MKTKLAAPKRLGKVPAENMIWRTARSQPLPVAVSPRPEKSTRATMMTTPPPPGSRAELLKAYAATCRAEQARRSADAARFEWLRLARPNQLAPEGDWYVWLLLARSGASIRARGGVPNYRRRATARRGWMAVSGFDVPPGRVGGTRASCGSGEDSGAGVRNVTTAGLSSRLPRPQPPRYRSGTVSTVGERRIPRYAAHERSEVSKEPP